MSVRRVLVCDHKNKCGTIFNPQELLKRPMEDYYVEDDDLIEDAEKAGWHIMGSISFCPKCKKEGNL